MADPAWYTQGKELTKKFEGFRDKPYKDTKGIWTNGYGFNLQAHPEIPKNITREAADQWFDQFYGQAAQTAQKFAGDRWTKLDDGQKSMLTDMAYNLHNKLFGFQKMQQAMQVGDNGGVQQQMGNSNWAKQTGQRAQSDIFSWAAGNGNQGT